MDSIITVAIVQHNTSIVALSDGTKAHSAKQIMVPWLLPVMVGVTMVIFLMISFAIHHRRFLQQRRHSFKLYVVHGQRVASPSIPSKDLVPPLGDSSTLESAEDASQLSPRRLAVRLLEIFKTKNLQSTSSDVSGVKDVNNDVQLGHDDLGSAGLPTSLNCLTFTPLSSVQGRSALKGRPFVVTTFSGILTKANLKPSDLLVTCQSCDDFTKVGDRHVHVTSSATHHEDTHVHSSEHREPGQQCSNCSSQRKVNNGTKEFFNKNETTDIRVSRDFCFVEELSTDISEDGSGGFVLGNETIKSQDCLSTIPRYPVPLSSTKPKQTGTSECSDSLRPVNGSSFKSLKPPDMALGVVSHFENISGVHSNSTIECKCHCDSPTVESSSCHRSSHLKNETVGSLLTMKEVTKKLQVLLSESLDGLVDAEAKTLEGFQNRSRCAGCDTCNVVMEILGELSEDDCNNVNEFLETFSRIGQKKEIKVVRELVSGDGTTQLGEVSGQAFGSRESENGSWTGSCAHGYLDRSLTSLHDVVQ